MSTSLDPQTWIFPPLGAASLPADVSAAFGPISQGDKIKLEWAPASSTPEIAFICANDGTTYGASDSSTSPYTLNFDMTINNGSSHICWFFFPGTTLGNTLTFQYNNDGTGSSVLWEQDSQLAQALSGGGSGSSNDGSGGGGGGAASTITTTETQTETVTVTETKTTNGGTVTSLIGSGVTVAAAATTYTFTETFTETITQTPSTVLTTIIGPSTTFISTSVVELPAAAQNTDSTSADANVSSASSTSGLSAGAAAGITAAAVIALALLLLLGWWLFRRRNRGDVQGSAGNPGVGPGVDVGPVVVPAGYKQQPPPPTTTTMQQQQQMQQQQGQPLMQGYYHPGSASASVPRRTIHEIGD